MAIKYHPEQGSILVCDFDGFKAPEMVKRRPVVVISPRLRNRTGLCTVVPLSSTPPKEIAPYHFRLHTTPALPSPYNNPHHWVKADMIYTVAFDRLSALFAGKDESGKRIHDYRVIDSADLKKIQECVLHSLGLTVLTSYL